MKTYFDINGMKLFTVASLDDTYSDNESFAVPDDVTHVRSMNNVRLIKGTRYIAHVGLADFYESLSSAIPSIQLLPRNGTRREVVLVSATGTVETMHPVVSSFHVFVKGDFLTRGWINHEDMRDEDTRRSSDRYNRPTYNVFSRTIQNNKYRSYSDKFHMAAAKNLTTAIRTAKKNFTRVTHAELRTPFIEDLTRARSNVRWEAGREAQRAMGAVRVSDIVYQIGRGLEIANEFTLDLETKEKIMEAYTTKRAASALEEPLHGFYLQVEPLISGRDVLHVYELKDINKDQYGIFYESNIIEYKTYNRLEDVPTDLVGRVSVLQMAEDNTYVVNVGSRTDRYAFLVEAFVEEDAE